MTRLDATGSAPAGPEAGVLSSQRWRRLIPIAFVTYSLAYLDRSNYSIGAAGGLEQDLHINSAQSGFLAGLFFAGYFLFQIPAAQYAENKSVKRLVFWCLLLWGVFAAAQGVIPWLWLLMLDRFALGVVEAAILPAMLIFLAHWFTSSERGRADSFLILGNPVTVMWLSVVSGYIISWTSWRWMFIIEGLPAIAWAFAFRALTADRPADATWLNESERKAVSDRIAAEQQHLPEVTSYWHALKSRDVIVLSVQYLLWSLGVYGFVFWLPSIISAASSNGIGRVGVLSAVPYALAVILMVVNSRLSDRTGPTRRRLHVWPWLLLGAVTFYASYQLGTKNFLPSFLLLLLAGGCLYAPYGPYFAAIPEFLPQNVAGVAMALINSAGAVGGFLGTYLVGWLDGATGGPGASFLVMGASLLLAGLLMFAVRGAPSAIRRTPARV
ncbi:MAG: MFS transporter [Nocardioidaceae bacterium]